jgi:hypothetical protein
MMTQSHILIGLSLFGRPRESARNAMAIAGGIIPDAAIFVLYVIEKLRGTPESVIWRDVYFSPFWQDAVAWGNSIPLWLTILVLAALVGTKFKRALAGSLMVAFAGSCLAHMACDFPVHVDDAHRHLFPLSSWRFRSIVSYWDPNHFGTQFAIFEAMVGIALAIWSWIRFQNVLARIGIALMLTSYLAVPAWFAWQFFSSQT